MPARASDDSILRDVVSAGGPGNRLLGEAERSGSAAKFIRSAKIRFSRAVLA